MLAFYRKYYKTVFDIALLLLTIYLFMLLFSYLYGIAKPIFIAFVIFLIIEPLARFLHRRGMKKSIATAISTIIFTLVILGALTGAAFIFTTQLLTLKEKLPEYAAVLQKEIILRSDFLKTRIDAVPEEVMGNIIEKAKEYATIVTEKGSKIAVQFLSGTFNMLTSFSTFVVNFIVGIILAYFLSIEIEHWKKLAGSNTPKTFKTAYYFLKENVLIGIVGYLKAQLKLIGLTFIVIFIALLVLNVDNAFSIALLSAIFDVLPLLGVSTVFIPWIIYLFVVGSTKLAICLSVLLGIVILVRQIMEPKITGDSLGVSAFTMLAFMIISLSLFGVAGLILSPVLIILIKALYEQGYLQRWIRRPEEEYEPERL
jgi:sporulation integral membrane protein YtvI